ncbi:MAG: hypothetical protein N2490_04170 [Ignavibacteria bacterium]|nr:hypothetical protein [Ignavibacteria bacterium]
MKLLKTLLTILLLFGGYSFIYSQPYYGFNFDKEWEWVELIYGNYNVSPTSKALVEELEKMIDINDARILFKNLSLLDSLNQVKDLIYIAELDSLIQPIDFKQKLENAFMYFDAVNNLDGLIYTAYILAPLQKNSPFNYKTYKERKPLLNVVDTLNIDFRLEYDYRNAELILDLLNEKDIDYYNELENKLPEYSQKIKLDKEKINLCFQYATNNSPLYNIYKVINPTSFSNLGGIYLYKERILKTIGKYKKDENLITFEVKNRVFQFLPPEVSINTKINFSLGFEVNNDFFTNQIVKETYLNIEPFGENYLKLVKHITRQLFIKGRNQIYTNILPFTVKGSDSVLVYILNEVQSGGVLNYIAPILDESRPLSLLEKDFQFFKRIINELSYSKKEIIDSLIREGLSGFAMFHTMGTEMTFTMDRLMGKQGIKNSLVLGPIHFFDNYINVYYDNKKIRTVFRFSEAFEEKIKTLKTLYDENIAFEVLKLSLKQKENEKNLDKWREILINESAKIVNKYKNHYKLYLANLYLADLLFKEGVYDESVKYYSKVIASSDEKIKVFMIIYSMFEKRSLYQECKLISTEIINHIPNFATGYLLRGIANFKISSFNEAKSDFEKVLQFDPYNNDAINYLNQIGNQ